MTEAVQGVDLVLAVGLGGDEQRAARAEGDVAAALANDARAHRSGGVVPRPRDDFDARKPELLRDLFLERSHDFETFVELGEHALGDAAQFQHLLGPAAVLNVQKQHAARVREVSRERPREAVGKVVLGQHDLGDLREVLGLMLSHPENFRRGEARKGDVACPCGELVLADRPVEVSDFLLRAAVVPKNGGADDIVVLIECNEAVHLPAEGDALDGRLILPREEFMKAAENGGEPVLGVLLAPTGVGIGDRVSLGIFGKDGAVRGDEQKF